MRRRNKEQQLAKQRAEEEQQACRWAEEEQFARRRAEQEQPARRRAEDDQQVSIVCKCCQILVHCFVLLYTLFASSTYETKQDKASPKYYHCTDCML